MGWTLVERRLTASLSNHNSVDDKIDRVLWEDMLERLTLIIEDKRYEKISPTWSALK